MRTNIDLDDDLVRRARVFSRQKTKKALIEEALRTFIETRSAEQERQTYAERAQSLHSRLGGLRLSETPFEVLKRDRDR